MREGVEWLEKVGEGLAGLDDMGVTFLCLDGWSDGMHGRGDFWVLGAC